MRRLQADNTPCEHQRLLKRLDEEVSRAYRHDIPLSLVVFRLTMPEEGGTSRDELTRAAVLFARAMVRKSDIVEPLGAGEFGVVANTGREGAGILAQSLQKHLEAMDFAVGERVVGLGVRYALSSLRDGKRAEDLLNEARALLSGEPGPAH